MKLMREVPDVTHEGQRRIGSARNAAPGGALYPGGASITVVEEVTRLTNRQGVCGAEYSPTGRVCNEQASTVQARLNKGVWLDAHSYVLGNGAGGGHSRLHKIYREIDIDCLLSYTKGR